MKKVLLFTLMLFSLNISAEVLTGKIKTVNWTFDTNTGILDFKGTGALGRTEMEYALKAFGKEGVKEMCASKDGECYWEDGGGYFGFVQIFLLEELGAYDVEWISEEDLEKSKAQKILNNLKKVIVGEGITSIDFRFFKGLPKVEELKLPQSLRKIGDEAFAEMEIDHITIPEGIVEIPSYCFSGCSNLETITIPKSVTKIGEGAFEGCESLYEVKLLNPNTKIASGAIGTDVTIIK